MKTIKKYLMMFVLSAWMIGSVFACKKQNGDKPSTEGSGEETTQTAMTPVTSLDTQATAEPSSAPEETDPIPEVEPKPESYRQDNLPIEITFPQDAVVNNAEDAFYAETSEYLLCVFGMDTYNNGIIYDEMDVLSILNSSEDVPVAMDMLRLKGFSIPENNAAQIYKDFNGMNAFYCPLSAMEHANPSGEVVKGDGFVMAYGNETGIGAYVVLGIVKDYDASKPSDRGREVESIITNSAKSLKQTADAKEVYTIWNDTMPDGVKAKAVYKTESVTEVTKGGDGVYFYYAPDHSGYTLIRHFNMIGEATSEDHIKVIIEDLKRKEGFSFSEIEAVSGKMSYQKVTLSYEQDGKNMQEIICVSANKGGSTWLVEIYGTFDEVKKHLEDLSTFLWSLQED